MGTDPVKPLKGKRIMDKDHCISRLGFLKGASFAAFAGVAGRAVAADNGGVDAAQTGEAQLSQRPWLSTDGARDAALHGDGPGGGNGGRALRQDGFDAAHARCGFAREDAQGSGRVSGVKETPTLIQRGAEKSFSGCGSRRWSWRDLRGAALSVPSRAVP